MPENGTQQGPPTEAIVIAVGAVTMVGLGALLLSKRAGPGPGQCTGGAVWDEAQQRCVCPAGTVWDEVLQRCVTPGPGSPSARNLRIATFTAI